VQTPIWFLTNGIWRLGPLTLDQTIAALQQAEPPVDVYVWREGMDTWVRPEAAPELATATGTLPSSIPAPPAAPPPGAPGWAAGSVPPAAAAVHAAPPAPAPWFVVGPAKLVVMSVATLGLYQVFWFYRHWQQARDHQHKDVWPVPRAIFAVIFAYPLFRDITGMAAARGHTPVPDAILSTTAFVGLTFAQILPSGLWLIAFGSVFALLPIQRAANAIALEAAPGTDPNTRFTRLNWVGIVVGGLVLLLALIGALLPQETRAAVSLASAALRRA
jgi:GYF domain 2